MYCSQRIDKVPNSWSYPPPIRNRGTEWPPGMQELSAVSRHKGLTERVRSPHATAVQSFVQKVPSVKM